MQLPIYTTKVNGVTEEFNLNTVEGRHKYFHAKAGKQIEEIKTYLDNNTFVAFMLAKKSAGKGTYSKLFIELVGNDKVHQISVGDLIRKTHELIESDSEELNDLYEYVKNHYRGFVSSEDALKSIIERSTDKINIPTELILVLIRREIEKNPEKSFILDGFPRTGDQITYSLFFREIMNLRPDPDFFVVIDVPDSIIDERIKYRKICPICNLPRNYKLLPTDTVKFNKETKEFELVCDNPQCEGFGKAILINKEGDELGIEPLRSRLETDQKLIEQALELHGIPCVKVRNHIPVTEIGKYDKYEITPEFKYTYNEQEDKVEIHESDWIVKDNDGNECHSLLPSAAVLVMINQIHQILTAQQ